MARQAEHVSATFSLVALDQATGYLGSACASKYFAVGAVVPHLERCVGAFNTQHYHRPLLAEQGLALMRTGTDPQAAIEAVLADDDQPAKRQLLAIDAQGRRGAWTGQECNQVCGHVIGQTCVAAGNTLAGVSVVEAMVAYMDTHAGEPFGLRLIGALDAAQAQGGDFRGKQAAAIATVPANAAACDPDWVNIRVDDAQEPLIELRRMYKKRWQDKR